MKTAPVVVALLLLASCRREGGSDEPSSAGGPAKTPAAATPVRLARVARRTVRELVTAPGKTSALSQQKLRAPFAGTVTELRVIEGDRVRRGQVVGSIVARESEAALSGAREMVRQASTPEEKRDGQRALALAEANLVRRPLVAAWSGAVLARTASAGDRVTEDQEILTIEDAASVVFLADVSQADLSRVVPGQGAEIEISGRQPPLAAVVHGVLPSANAADFTGSVRLDLSESVGDLPLGLFGTARITVGGHIDSMVVPDAAILRDDVTGISRVALVARDRAHWIDVRTGLREGGFTEISQPPLSEGQAIIVSGLVGLPEGQPVLVRP